MLASGCSCTSILLPEPVLFACLRMICFQDESGGGVPRCRDGHAAGACMLASGCSCTSILLPEPVLFACLRMDSPSRMRQGRCKRIHVEHALCLHPVSRGIEQVARGFSVDSSDGRRTCFKTNSAMFFARFQTIWWMRDLACRVCCFLVPAVLLSSREYVRCEFGRVPYRDEGRDVSLPR